jgi:hypothetical protein
VRTEAEIQSQELLAAGSLHIAKNDWPPDHLEGTPVGGQENAPGSDTRSAVRNRESKINP